MLHTRLTRTQRSRVNALLHAAGYPTMGATRTLSEYLREHVYLSGLRLTPAYRVFRSVVTPALAA